MVKASLNLVHQTGLRIMGRRKFRLVNRKNAERSTVPKSLEISIPKLQVSEPMSLEISIPKAKLHVSDFSSLNAQIYPLLQASPWTHMLS